MPPSPLIFFNWTIITKYYRVNNRITAPQVRVIDETGKQIGVLPLEEAFEIVKEKKLDLVEIVANTDPPVCKITDFGKFLYQEQKKERKTKRAAKEVKGIRLSFGISAHDMDVKAEQCAGFLKEGHKVKIDMVLRGREKALREFSFKKFRAFLDAVRAKQDFRAEQDVKKMTFGFSMVIMK